MTFTGSWFRAKGSSVRHGLNKLDSALAAPSVHHHPTKDKTFILLRVKVWVLTYNDEGKVQEDVVLSLEDDRYGVYIPKGAWHKLESLEPGSVMVECKEGPFVPHEEDGILGV